MEQKDDEMGEEVQKNVKVVEESKFVRLKIGDKELKVKLLQLDDSQSKMAKAHYNQLAKLKELKRLCDERVEKAKAMRKEFADYQKYKKKCELRKNKAALEAKQALLQQQKK